MVILLGEAFSEKEGKIWIQISIGGLFLCGAVTVLFFVNGAFPGAEALGVLPIKSEGFWIQYATLSGMISVDSLAMFFKLILIVGMIMVFWLSSDYREYSKKPLGTYSALLLLATVGMMLLVGSNDFLMAVVALELLSIPSFILTGFILNRRSSIEGALKFFLVGTFSTALLLFGISYYYGYFGTTSIAPLLLFPFSGQETDFVLGIILVFIISGLGFKLAMVPFHMWVPDAYEGAPTPITAFLSVAPKAAAVGFLIRILSHHVSLNVTPVLAVLAALTMTVGNLGALHQTNIKRLLAYSSVAQMGYILVAFVAGGVIGRQAATMYTFIYLVMNLGVFSVLILVSNRTHSDDLPSFAGLSKSHFGLSFALVLFLLSLTGIPPLAGFIGKFTIFAAVIQAENLLWLGIVAVINSVVSLYYYFRIAHQMYFCQPREEALDLRFSPALTTCLAVALGLTVFVGLMPDWMLGWVRNVVGS